MITSIKNFLTPSQCEYFMKLYEDNLNDSFLIKDKFYSFFAINLIKLNIPFEDIEPRLKGSYYEDRLRVQSIPTNFEVNENYHIHINYSSFSIFLNDDYEGGELEFENGDIYKPEQGLLVKFHQNDAHRVNAVTSGNRLTLVGLLDSDNTNNIIGFPISKQII